MRQPHTTVHETAGNVGTKHTWFWSMLYVSAQCYSGRCENLSSNLKPNPAPCVLTISLATTASPAPSISYRVVPSMLSLSWSEIGDPASVTATTRATRLWNVHTWLHGVWVHGILRPHRHKSQTTQSEKRGNTNVWTIVWVNEWNGPATLTNTNLAWSHETHICFDHDDFSLALDSGWWDSLKPALRAEFRFGKKLKKFAKFDIWKNKSVF